MGRHGLGPYGFHFGLISAHSTSVVLYFDSHVVKRIRLPAHSCSSWGRCTRFGQGLWFVSLAQGRELTWCGSSSGRISHHQSDRRCR